MSGYTVYGVYPSSLGDPVGPDDVGRWQEIMNDELAASPVGARADVVMSDNLTGYSFIPAHDEELRAVVDRAFERFYSENG